MRPLPAFIAPAATARAPSRGMQNRTAVVTGATRGIGRGLAIGLGEAGAHVIITGRTKEGPFSLSSTAAAVAAVGGTCESYVVDHNDDGSIRDFFTRLRGNQHRLDVFVNNAYSGVAAITGSMDVPFWEKSADNPAAPDAHSDPGKFWDVINGVGLRNNYVCAVYATRMMREQGGLIVNVSSWGGLVTLFDAAYSVGKEGVDRMTAELAAAAPEGVRFITLYPGFVGTESLLEALAARSDEEIPEELPVWNCETPLFVGRVLAAIAGNEAMMKSMNGKIVVAAEAAEKLGINDENDFRCMSFRSIRFTLLSKLPFLRTSPLRHLIPRTLYAPWWLARSLTGAVQYWN